MVISDLAKRFMSFLAFSNNQVSLKPRRKPQTEHPNCLAYPSPSIHGRSEIVHVFINPEMKNPFQITAFFRLRKAEEDGIPSFQDQLCAGASSMFKC